MRIPHSELSITDIVDVRRVRNPRTKKDAGEVSVVFVDVETRDRVASYAKNLSDYIENGKPTATFRPEIPTHLTGVHKTLLSYGYAMGLKHKTGYKRNIRFDDETHSFVIDIKLPGSDSQWFTVTYERALADRQDGLRSTERDRGVDLSSRGSGPEPEQEKQADATTPSLPTTPTSTPAATGSSSASGTGRAPAGWHGPQSTDGVQQKNIETWGSYR